MIGIDSNVLARYYIADDQNDVSTTKQRDAARRLIESGDLLMVSKTVMFEFEWVLRGYYGLGFKKIRDIFDHLLAMDAVDIEDRETVTQALEHASKGLDFADALHLASYRECKYLASFDDKKFARRVAKLGLSPRVLVPS